MQNTSPKQFVIYSRKSKFTGKGDSIGNQIELCRQYIASHYSHTEAASAFVYEDEGFSGGTLDRPQFRKMMKDSATYKFFAIVVYRLDRISRNIGDFAKLIEELGERDIAFISVREQFDTSSPIGRAMMYIASVFSQLERETIAERIRDNMQELAKTGRWLGGVTPTGYASENILHVTIDGKERKACRLKIIPGEMETVRNIYTKFTETGSLIKVDQYLQEKRITTKKGNRFTRFAVKAILSNPVYMIADEAAYEYFTANHADLFAEKDKFDGIHGIMTYNRTHQKPGKTTQIKPIQEWIVSVGKHEGIISGEQWVYVQNMLDWNRSKNCRKPRSHTALLSGVLYCAGCGNSMRAKLSGHGSETTPPVYRYLCTAKEHSRREACNVKNADGNLLDERIADEIKKLGQNTYSCVHNLPNHPLYTEIFQKQPEETESIASGRVLSDSECEKIQCLLSDFGSVLDDMNIEQKRSVIRTLVKRVLWDGENAHLYLYDSEEIFPPSGEDSE